MILPDVYNSDSAVHARARAWWEARMNDSAPVGLAWAALLGFVRMATHRAILRHPMPVKTACGHIRSWLAQPQVTILQPGERHAPIVLGLLEALGSAGNLTTDAHLAALAIEYQAELHTTDADFARFAGLRFRNPLAARNKGA